MKNFRLPRKVKKGLKGNMWLYPPDEKGNSLMASPKRSQEDYNAVKKGEAKPLVDRKNAKEKRKAYREKMNKVVFVTDEELKTFVDDIFAERYRKSSYNNLLLAKNNPKAVVAYYNFINAYHFYKDGQDSYANICCLAADYAKELLKK
jgi:hypothetical protein